MEDPTIDNFLLEITRAENLVRYSYQDAQEESQKLAEAVKTARELASNPKAHDLKDEDFQEWTKVLETKLDSIEYSDENRRTGSAAELSNLNGYFASEIKSKVMKNRV